MGIFTRFSMKNILVIFLIIAMLIAGGVYSLGSIQTEMMPNISFPIITVVTVYPGAAPDDIAEGISRPIQKALSGIQGIKKVDATSNENLSLMILSFDYSANMEKAETDVKTAIDKVTLPERAQKPKIAKVSYGSIPVVGYSVSYSGNEEEFSKLITDKIQPSLSGIKGMGGVSINGLNDKQVFIKLDESKMKAKGVTTQDVQQALTANNISYPIGTVDFSEKTLPVRVTRKIENLNEIKAIPIVVMPNTNKVIGESMAEMGKAIGGAYSAIGELGKSMGQLGQAVGEIGSGVGDLGQGVTGIGSATGANSQAIALISMIQKNQAMILTSQEALKNPSATKQEIEQASQQIAIATQTNIALQKTLDDILNKMASDAKKSNMNNSKSASTTSNSFGSSESMNSSNQNNPLAKLAESAKDISTTKNSNKIELKTVYLKDIANITYEKGELTFYSRTNLKPTVTFYAVKNDDVVCNV